MITVSKETPRGVFNETLTMIGTVYKNKATGVYKEKQSSLIIKVKTEQKTKSVGLVKLDLAKYIDQPERSEEL